MEGGILRIVHKQVASGTGPEAAAALNEALALLEAIREVQSQPSESAQMLQDSLRGSSAVDTLMSDVHRAVVEGRRLTPEDWLALTYFATMRAELQTRWDDVYSVVLDAFPGLRHEVNKLLDGLNVFPFSASIAALEENWPLYTSDMATIASVLTYIRAAGLSGVLGTDRLYKQLRILLSFHNHFLVVVLAGACFKVPAVAAETRPGDWDDSQYQCMRLLDNFADLGDAAWG